MVRILFLTGMLTMAAGAGALAATDGPGNPGYGRGLANDICGECHIVSPDQEYSGKRLGPRACYELG